MREFKKFVTSLRVKAVPQYSISKATIYSFLESLDNNIVIDLLECFLLQGFNEQLKKLKKKLKIGKVSLNEAKKAIYDVKESLLDEIKEYSMEKSEASCVEIFPQDLPESTSLLKEKGINTKNVSRKVRKLDEKINSFSAQSLKLIELYSLKTTRVGGFSIGKNVPSLEVEMLYKYLTKPGEELIRCDIRDFESILRGEGDNKHRIKILNQATLLKLVEVLQTSEWYKPLGASYWQYVADNFEEFSGTRWKKENLRKNFGKKKGTDKTDSDDNPFGKLTPYKNFVI